MFLHLKRRVNFVLSCSLFIFLAILFNLVFLNDMQGLAPSSSMNAIAKLKLLFHLNPAICAGKDQSKDQPMVMILGTRHNKAEIYLETQIQNMIALGNLGSAFQLGDEGATNNSSTEWLFGLDEPLLRSYVLSIQGISNLMIREYRASARALLVYESRQEWMLPYWEKLSKSKYLTHKSRQLYQEVSEESLVPSRHPWENILGQKPVYIDPRLRELGSDDEWLDLYRAWIKLLTKAINATELVLIDEVKIQDYLDNPRDPNDPSQDAYIRNQIIVNARDRLMTEHIIKRLRSRKSPIKLMYVLVGRAHLPGMENIFKKEGYFDRVKFISLLDGLSKDQLRDATKRILDTAVPLIRENCLEQYVDVLSGNFLSQNEQEKLMEMLLIPKQDIFPKKLLGATKEDFGEISMIVKPKDKQREASIEEDNIADWLYLLGNTFYCEEFYQSIQRIVSLNALPPDFILKHFVLGDILLRNLIMVMKRYVKEQLNGKGVEELLLKDVCESFLLFYRKYKAIFDPMLSLNSYTFYNTMLLCEQVVKSEDDWKSKHDRLNDVLRKLDMFLDVSWRDIQKDLDQVMNIGGQEELRELFIEIDIESRLRLFGFKDDVQIDLRNILCSRDQWIKGTRLASLIFSMSASSLDEPLKCFEVFVGRLKNHLLFDQVVRENFSRLLENFYKTKNGAGIRRLFYFLYKDELSKDRKLYHFVIHQAFISNFFNVSDWFNVDDGLDVMRKLGLSAFWADPHFQEIIEEGKQNIHNFEDMLVFLSRLALRFKYDSELSPVDSVLEKEIPKYASDVHGDLTSVVDETDSELSLAS